VFVHVCVQGRPRLFYGQTLSFDVVVNLNNRTYNSSLDDPRSPYFRHLEYDFCSLVGSFFLIAYIFILILTPEVGSQYHFRRTPVGSCVIMYLKYALVMFSGPL